MYTSVWVPAFNSFVNIPRIEIACSYGNSINFLRSHQIVFHLPSITIYHTICFTNLLFICLLLALHITTNLNLQTTLWGRNYYYPHFTYKETEAENSEKVLITECQHPWGCKLQWRQGFLFVWFTAISHIPRTCLAQSRCTINIHWMNEWIWCDSWPWSRGSQGPKDRGKVFTQGIKTITSKGRKDGCQGGKPEIRVGDTIVLDRCEAAERKTSHQVSG